MRGLPSPRASPQTRGLAGGCQPPHAWPECNGRDAGRCSWRFVACPDNQTLAAYMPCSLRGIGFAAGARSRLRAWKQPEETAFPGIPSAAQARNEGKKHAIVRRRNRWSANTCTPSAHHPPASCMLQAVHSPEPGRAAQHRQRPNPRQNGNTGAGYRQTGPSSAFGRVPASHGRERPFSGPTCPLTVHPCPSRLGKDD